MNLYPQGDPGPDGEPGERGIDGFPVRFHASILSWTVYSGQCLYTSTIYIHDWVFLHCVISAVGHRKPLTVMISRLLLWSSLLEMCLNIWVLDLKVILLAEVIMMKVLCYYCKFDRSMLQDLLKEQFTLFRDEIFSVAAQIQAWSECTV